MSVIDAIIAKKLCGGGGSVPKPLTYDYMPEGYPKKTMETVTVMEEQELAFANEGGTYVATLVDGFEIVEGQAYTVSWDGTEYKCVGFVFNSLLLIGNPSAAGGSPDTGEPFAYANVPGTGGMFNTLDTSPTHTISVKTIVETVTPIAEEFLPANTKNTTVFYI